MARYGRAFPSNWLLNHKVTWLAVAPKTISPTGIASAEVISASRISQTLPTPIGNTAEGGTNGVTPTGVNSGGASGTAWDNFGSAGASTLIFDNTHSYETLAYKFDPDINSADYMGWTTAVGSLTDFYVRFQMYHTAFPGSTLTIARFLSGSTHQCSIRITSTGLLQAIDSSNAVVVPSFTNPIALNQWVRVEAHIVIDGTNGFIELKLFNNPDIDQATESANASGLSTGTVATAYRFGSTLGANTDLVPFWMDNVAIGTAGYLGPKVHVLKPTGIASGEAHGTTTVLRGAVTVTPTGIATGYASGTAKIVQTIAPTGIPSQEFIGGTAASIVQDTNPSNGQIAVSGGTTGTQEQVAQSFQFAATTIVDKVQLYLGRGGTTTDNLVVEIRDALDGTILASASMVISSITSGTPSAYYDFDFSASRPTLSAATTYYIQISRTGARDTNNAATVGVNLGGNPYASGSEWLKGGTGWVEQASGTNDLRFKVFSKGGGNVVTVGAAVLHPTGIVSAEAHGTTVVVATYRITPTGIATAYASGAARLILYLLATGIASGEAHGTTVVTTSYLITPTGIISGYAAGAARLILYLKPTGIATAEAHGTTTVTLSSVVITPTGIVSAEAHGTTVVVATYLITPTGIASAYASGNATVLRGTVTITPTGIATAYASGAARLILYLKPTGIASAEAHGTTAVTTLYLLSPTGIPTGYATGTARIILYLKPVGIASAEAHGTTAVVTGISVIGTTGIPTGYASGTATVLTFYTVLPTGVASAEAHGTTVVVAKYTVLPTGIATGYASGTTTVLTFYTVSPTGIVSAQAFGTAVVVRGAVTLSPTGIASGEAYGVPLVILYLVASGVPTSEAFGLASLYLLNKVFPTGIPTGQSMGHALLALYLVTTSIDSAEVFGQARFVGDLIITPGGIPSELAFGQILLIQVPFLFPDGIVSEEAFGATVVAAIYRLTITAGIPTAEAHGITLVIPGTAFVHPTGIISGYVSGTSVIVLYLKPTGIATAQSFGHDSLYALATIRPVGIASAQVFGIAHVLPGGVGIFPIGIHSAEAFGPGIIVFIFVVTIHKIGFYREVSSVSGRTTDGVIRKTGFYDGNGESKSGAETGLIKKTGEYHLVDKV